MSSTPTMDRSRRRRRTATLLLAVTFVAICLGPHIDRLTHPSLFTDDVARISDSQTKSLGSLLFRPFEEHMAPLFEVVSWVTWKLAGRTLVEAPVPFTLMSFLPFGLCLAALGFLIRGESGSSTTALVAVASFSLSSLHSEVIYWYSASSFAWALLFALLATHFAAEASRTGGRLALFLASVASAMAPAFSAIGLLAGPLAAIRLGLGADRRGPWQALSTAIIPPLGTFFYLGVCLCFRYQAVLASSVEHHADFGSGIVYVLCAPSHVLVPGIVGLNGINLGSRQALNVGLAILGLIGILAWAWRSPHRALILGGLWLVLGGYTMTYCFRTDRFGAPMLFRVERYHLFPLIGFTFWTALASRRFLGRFDGRPLASLGVATGLATLLLLTHIPTIHAHSRYYRFPNQAQTLAALDRLDDLCQRQGITRDQALEVLEPVRPNWSIFNALGMIRGSVETPSLPTSPGRGELVAMLSRADREALWGGMDASPYLKVAEDFEAKSGNSVGRLVGSHRVGSDRPGHWNPAGWPSYLEYEWPEPTASAPPESSLCVPGGTPGRSMEVWWSGRDGGWSHVRSVRWRPDPILKARAWSVPLDRLPHWDPAGPRRVRIVFRTAGPIAVDAPRLLR